MQTIAKVKIKTLTEHPFFGLLCSKLRFAIDPNCETACTDGETIYFGKEFSYDLSSEELAFILMHELMHVVQGHCFYPAECDGRLRNVAADIVVNSILLDELRIPDITIAGCEVMHLTPEGKEGRLYTVDQVYDMLVKECKKTGISESDAFGDKFLDDHSKWGSLENSTYSRVIMQQSIYGIVEQLTKGGGFGLVPNLAKRMVEEIKNPPVDWRTILNDFIQTEVTDYSFSPPDKRFSASDVLLPDFNDTQEKIENVFIAVDTSGSISDRDLSLALNEIKGALDQFEERFSGWLSYFDAKVSEPEPFENYSEVKNIKILGNGGTSFEAVFEKAKERFNGDLSCIIVITDGYAFYPDIKETLGVPVLWVMNNDRITPPWGKVVVMNNV